MIIFGGILLIVAVGMIVVCESYEGLGSALIVIGGVFLIMALSICVCNRYEVHGDIQEIKAIETTINNARQRDNLLESAAFQIKIAEANQKIASWKYYNNTIFDVFIPEVVETLEPIK